MAKKEWETRVLGEVKQGKAAVWRAQISTAPDGKEFAGIRKFILKADGTEIADRNGLTVLYEQAQDLIPQLKELLDTLQDKKVKKLNGEYTWYVKNSDDEYFKKSGVFVSKKAAAKAFLSKEEATAVAEKQEDECRVIKVKVKVA